MTPNKKIAFIVGSDITSHLIATELSMQIKKLGIEPMIFFSGHVATKNPHPEIKKLSVYEREITKNCIYPFLENIISHEERMLHTPNETKEELNIVIDQADDINNINFINRLKEENVFIVISIRCYQKFSSEFIENLSAQGCHLWNLHPGILPAYRGVMTLIRAMQNGDENFGFTLHKINEKWDAGDIIDIKMQPINYEHSMLYNLVTSRKLGIELALDSIKKAYLKEPIHSTPQDRESSRYYTFPTESEICDLVKKNITIVQHSEMLKLYQELYTLDSGITSKELGKTIELYLRNAIETKEPA